MSQYEKLIKSLKTNQGTWLVTGVAGFIGSNLLEQLLILNQKVIGLDNFDTGYLHNIEQAVDEASRAVGKDLSSNFKFIEGDIRELDDCKLACDGVDFVLHQAALGSVPRSIENPINTNRANIDGFLNVLIAARDANVERLVYAASSSTYGDHPALPKSEDKIGNPLSPYAVSKLVNELYADVFARTYGFKSIGLRYFNIFGKRQDPNGSYAAVIPKWILALIKEDQVFINGDGETSRDFCYIDNVIQMNLLSAMTKNSSAINQVYNVALNDRTSLNKLYQTISQNLTEKVNLRINEPIFKDFRVGDVKHSQADVSKAKNLLGYDPLWRIDRGIDKTIDWYLHSHIDSKKIL